MSLLRQPRAFWSSVAFHLLSAPPDYKLLDSRKLLAPTPRTGPGMQLVLNKRVEARPPCTGFTTAEKLVSTLPEL